MYFCGFCPRALGRWFFFLEDVCAFFIRTCGHKLGRLPAWHPVVSNTGRNLSLTLCQGLSLAKSLLGKPPGVARAGWRLGRLHRASETPSDSEELCRDSQPSARTCVQERRGFPLSPSESAGLSTCWSLNLRKLQCTCSQRSAQKPQPHAHRGQSLRGEIRTAPPYRLPADLHCEEPGRPAALSWGRPHPRPHPVTEATYLTTHGRWEFCGLPRTSFLIFWKGEVKGSRVFSVETTALVAE